MYSAIKTGTRSKSWNGNTPDLGSITRDWSKENSNGPRIKPKLK
jgi:hypothetical protein